MRQTGRYTSAILLITIGVLCIIDQINGFHTVSFLVIWWPVFIILLGIEYIIAASINHKHKRPLKLDIGGIIFTVVISVAVVAFTQSNSFSFPWGFNLANEIGLKFEQGTTNVPLESSIDQVAIQNVMGDVEIKSGTVSQIEITSTVIVNNLKQKEAQQVADHAKIESLSSGNKLTVEAKGDEYNGIFGIKQKSRINLVITMPTDRKVDVEVLTRNGKVIAASLPINKELTLKTTNGSIYAADIKANVHLLTTNGKIEADDIAGNADLQSTNGSLTLKEVSAAVTAHTTNGSLQFAAHSIGGNWDLQCTNGRIGINIPANGDYEINGHTSNGSATTNLPLQADKNIITGKAGSGKYLIKLQTTNSSITVNNIEP
jgi:DUF4097 and DUF4098 domain-containing protein YvlB